jgi:tetratricopeptide (TPR) repeat protein
MRMDLTNPLADVFHEIDTAADQITDRLLEAGQDPDFGPIEVRLHAMKMCALLFQRCRETWIDDPPAAVELASIALALAERLDEDYCGEEAADDARALAWAHLGNARRLAWQPEAAEEALRQAERYQDRTGGRHPQTQAEILGFQASLESWRGRPEAAITLLDRALAVCRQAGDPAATARLRVKKAKALGDAGRRPEAVQLFEEIPLELEPAADPPLFIESRYLLTLDLQASGRGEEALSLLNATRELCWQFDQLAPLTRLRALEGRFQWGLGRPLQAEAFLRRARASFRKQRLAVEAALVSLDLAEVHFERGETAELQRAAAEAVPILASGGVRPPMRAALLRFREALEAGKVSRELLDELGREVEQVRRDLASERSGPIGPPL